MVEIDWTLIDDHQFVGLVAALLERSGFVDVAVQGHGPDGGLDIIATELLSSKLTPARPFRWGVQCKYSTASTARSVSPDEVQDVEGILRSSRYTCHRLSGYLLVTNRRVTQNVVERLQGLADSGRFRAEYVDGHRLESALGSREDLLRDYFDLRHRKIEALEREQLRELASERRIESPPSMAEEPASRIYLGTLTGVWRATEGVIHLDHDVITNVVTGYYAWDSPQPVARLSGHLANGVVRFTFEWLNGEASGTGFLLVSEDGDRFDGLWLLDDDIGSRPLEYVCTRGTRWSAVRVE